MPEAKLYPMRLTALHAPRAGVTVETLSEGRAGLAPNGVKIAYAAPQPKGELVQVVPQMQQEQLAA